MKLNVVDVEQAKDKENLFRTSQRQALLKRYGSILGTRISPISIFAVRYFEKNYGKILKSIPKSSKILEVGAGSANFTQYLLYEGYGDITVCEIADDNAQSLSRFFGDRIRIYMKMSPTI